MCKMDFFLWKLNKKYIVLVILKNVFFCYSHCSTCYTLSWYFLNCFVRCHFSCGHFQLDSLALSRYSWGGAFRSSGDTDDVRPRVTWVVPVSLSARAFVGGGGEQKITGTHKSSVDGSLFISRISRDLVYIYISKNMLCANLTD